MTKQEEIRKGIAKLTEDRFRAPAEGAGLKWADGFNCMLAGDILSYLDSKDVAIKVEGGFPKDRNLYGLASKYLAAGCYSHGQKDLIEDEGYTAWEALME